MLMSSDLTSTTTPPLGLPCVDSLIAGLKYSSAFNNNDSTPCAVTRKSVQQAHDVKSIYKVDKITITSFT